MLAHRVMACAICALFLTACESESQPLAPFAEPPLSALSTTARKAPEPMPRALRAAYVQAVQRDAPPEYAIRKDVRSILGENPAQGLRSAFDDEAVTISPGENTWRFGLRLVGVDGRKVAPAEPRAAGNRVEYDRGAGVTEWWLNGPLGLEQGFTIAEAAGDEVVIDLESLGGLTIADSSPEHVSWDVGDGRRLRYAELHAWDAEGEPLEAAMEAAGDALRLVVDVRGARFPVVVDPMLVLETKLVRPSGAEGGFAGFVALDGDTAMVAGGDIEGVVYVFERGDDGWEFRQSLTESEAGIANFGRAIALDDDTALISANRNDSEGVPLGLDVAVFVRAGGTWSRQATLVAADGVHRLVRVGSVALHGDTAVVTDIFDSEDRGAAFVYERSGSTWSETATLVAADVTTYFGESVALDGDTAVIGAPGAGAAYVFVRGSDGWSQQQKLVAGVGSCDGCGSFGVSLALQGDTLLVGDPGADAGTGAAYVFERRGTTWSERPRLTATDDTSPQALGYVVALDERLALLNSLGTERAYVFWRDDQGDWSQAARLEASDGALGDNFSMTLALDADTALIGARGAAGNAGAAYLFDLVPDAPPSQVALSAAQVEENAAGGTRVGTLSTLDSHHDTHQYTLVDDAGGRFELAPGDEVRVAEGAALDYEAATSHDIVVRSVDRTEHAVDQTLTIEVTPVNEAPVLETPTAGAAFETRSGTSLTLTVSGTDVDGDTLTLQVTPLPEGASFDASSGTFVWVPGRQQVGVHGLTIAVSDGELSDRHDVSVRVLDALGPVEVDTDVADATDTSLEPGDDTSSGSDLAEADDAPAGGGGGEGGCCRAVSTPGSPARPLSSLFVALCVLLGLVARRRH